MLDDDRRCDTSCGLLNNRVDQPTGRIRFPQPLGEDQRHSSRGSAGIFTAANVVDVPLEEIC